MLIQRKLCIYCITYFSHLYIFKLPVLKNSVKNVLLSNVCNEKCTSLKIFDIIIYMFYEEYYDIISGGKYF